MTAIINSSPNNADTKRAPENRGSFDIYTIFRFTVTIHAISATPFDENKRSDQYAFYKKIFGYSQ